MMPVGFRFEVLGSSPWLVTLVLVGPHGKGPRCTCSSAGGISAGVRSTSLRLAALAWCLDADARRAVAVAAAGGPS